MPDLYRDFYRWIGRPELLKLDHRQHLEYADVFALIYLRLRLEGISAYDHVKHLLVDEMQDYTPVQYAVLSRLFPCRKTILGDVSQTVNPYSASSAETIERVFPQADVVKLLPQLPLHRRNYGLRPAHHAQPPHHPAGAPRPGARRGALRQPERGADENRAAGGSL